MTEGITIINPGQRVPQLGKTTISDEVVAQLVEIATREVQGIHGIAKQGMGEQIAGLTQRLTGKRQSGQGIVVEVGEREVAIDLRIIADYGVKVPDLAVNLRRALLNALNSFLVSW